MAAIRPRSTVSAWRPGVAGIAEVFHARFTDHAYPAHIHDTWALMILDGGRVDFALDRERHGVGVSDAVVLLPPGVAHDGRTVTEAGFRKRVLYLDTSVLPERLAGAAVDTPLLFDRALLERVHGLHLALGSQRSPAEGFEAQSRLAFVRERLWIRLAGRGPPPAARGAGRGAGRGARGSPYGCANCSTRGWSRGSPWRRRRRCWDTYIPRT